MGEVGTATDALDSRCILLTDIYQSSRLSELYPGQYPAVLATHNAAVEKAVASWRGQVYKNTGDGYIAFFDRAAECVACAVMLQREFSAFPPFGDDDPLLVRVVAHGGVLRTIGSEFYGPALNRASRICQVCHPGQVLVSDAVAACVDQPTDSAGFLDLGEHHLRDLAEPVHLYQLDHEDFARREFPPLPTLGNRPNNLVEQPNTFIGRRHELNELKAMLLNGARLVTITAPGGYGKSRLATHLCADLLESFERGVFFLELGPLRDHTGIETALANATGFQFHGSGDQQEQLIDYLREKEMLLCFDNFEHVLDGASFVGAVIREASKVKVAVTTREPLRIRGEQVYPLQPLPVGRLQHEHSDAVLLFVDRASLVSPGFSLSEQSLPLVRDICTRLSGIPLAIELAAAWMDSFTLAELLAELDQQLELTARLSDVPERHRSLRASLDWSWNLLSDEQRQMLMRLSAFRGGCFAEAASAVLGARGMALRQKLSELADKSWLITREVDGLTRFFLRDAASREYVFEKLAATRTDSSGGLYEQAVMAHVRFFSELMEREGPRLEGHGQLDAFRLLRLEIQNIYEALDTLLNRLQQADAPDDIEGLLLPIARWLWVFLNMSSEFRECAARYAELRNALGPTTHLKTVLVWAHLGCSKAHLHLGAQQEAVKEARSANTIAQGLHDQPTLATVLHHSGRVAWMQGNFEVARAYCSEALAIAREVDDRNAVSVSLNTLATIDARQGDFDLAGRLLTESIAIMREIGDRWGISYVLLNQGNVEQHLCNYDKARELYNESLAIRREFGDRSGITDCLNQLGILEGIQGRFAAARDCFIESLTIRRELGSRLKIAASINNLGIVEKELGNYDEARALYTESLAIRRSVGDRSGTAGTLHNLGNVECLQGMLTAAREHIAESLALFRTMGDRNEIANCLHGLGNAEVAEGRRGAARPLLEEALAIRRDIADRAGVAVLLTSLASLESAEGHTDLACRLIAESLAIRAEIGDHNGLCLAAGTASRILFAAGRGEPAVVCLYGARYHSGQLGVVLTPTRRQAQEADLAAIENPDSGMAPDERARLKAQAEAMSIDELAQYALEALGKLEPD